MSSSGDKQSQAANQAVSREGHELPSGRSAPQVPASTSDIHWDDSKLVSHYADVVNLQSTREQVYLFFGTNQTWSLSEKGSDAPVRVELNSRVVLSPHAAKRLLLALDDILKKYESRFGEIRV